MAALHSSTSTQAREDKAIYRALSILKSRMREQDIAIAGYGTARDYLRILLAGETREVFAVLYLDAQNRVIEAEKLFLGTIAQTVVYPREVLRQSLHHNAVSVIFAHNHPSGAAIPSNADKQLTCTLIEALALVDIRVLDHFIVAGLAMASFSEMGILGQRDPPESKPDKSRRGRPRKNQETATT